MHKIITQKFDANFATSRANVTAINGAKCGDTDVSNRSIGDLRRLESMPRHRQLFSHSSGSAHVFSGTSQRYLTESERGQVMDRWSVSYQGSPTATKCQIQTNKCLKPALTVQSLVTT